MATIQVQPRPTPEERHDGPVEIEVDEATSVLVSTLEDWAAARQGWECTLQQGHDFGRANNVECRLLFAGGEHSCVLSFRLDQLETADDTGQELVLRFEEADGQAKLATLRANGMDVELFHIVRGAGGSYTSY